jgi:hypothetical protein
VSKRKLCISLHNLCVKQCKNNLKSLRLTVKQLVNMPWFYYHNSWDIHKQTKKKQTPWSESASELYRPSDRRFSAKWLPMLDKIGTMKIVLIASPLRQQAFVVAVLFYFCAFYAILKNSFFSQRPQKSLRLPSVSDKKILILRAYFKISYDNVSQ